MWLENTPGLLEEIEAAKQNCRMKAKETIHKHLSDPNVAKWYAERKMKDEGYSGRVELTDGEGNPISVKSILVEIR